MDVATKMSVLYKMKKGTFSVTIIKRRKVRKVPSLLFTDGSNSLKTGWCGWGITGMIEEKRFRMAGAMKGTNQLAELYAVVMAIKQIPKGGRLRIVSDSMYAINCMTTFRKKWETNGFKNYQGREIAHMELVKVGHGIMDTRIVEFVHVRGHTGNPGNEEADKLSRYVRYMAEGTHSDSDLHKAIKVPIGEAVEIILKDMVL